MYVEYEKERVRWGTKNVRKSETGVGNNEQSEREKENGRELARNAREQRDEASVSSLSFTGSKTRL